MGARGWGVGSHNSAGIKLQSRDFPVGPVAQSVKNPPGVQEIGVPSLGWEDPLGKGMATHSSVLAWRIPWTEEPGGLQSMGSQSQTRLSDNTYPVVKTPSFQWRGHGLGSIPGWGT